MDGQYTRGLHSRTLLVYSCIYTGWHKNRVLFSNANLCMVCGSEKRRLLRARCRVWVVTLCKTANQNNIYIYGSTYRLRRTLRILLRRGCGPTIVFIFNFPPKTPSTLAEQRTRQSGTAGHFHNISHSSRRYTLNLKRIVDLLKYHRHNQLLLTIIITTYLY